jgi:hypothetical protein
MPSIAHAASFYRENSKAIVLLRKRSLSACVTNYLSTKLGEAENDFH